MAGVLRDIGVVVGGCELETLGGNIFAIVDDQRNHQPQRLAQRGLLRHRTQSDGRCGIGPQCEHDQDERTDGKERAAAPFTLEVMAPGTVWSSMKTTSTQNTKAAPAETVRWPHSIHRAGRTRRASG